MAEPSKPKQTASDKLPMQDLSAKRVLALGQLLQGVSFRAISKNLSVNTTTIWRWTKEPEFAEVLASLQADVTEEARKRLKSLAYLAVEELADLATNPDAKVRLGAVNSILDRCGLTGRTEDSSAMQETMEKLFGDGSGAFKQAQGLVLASVRKPA